MTTEQRTCVSCGTLFPVRNTVFSSYKCSTCLQTEKMAEQAELDRQNNNRIQEQNAFYAAQQAAIIQSNALATIAAIEKQTKTIEESAISDTDVYDYGYYYIDTEFSGSNTASLSIAVNENGSLSWTWEHPYITERLREKFRNGLCDRLNTLGTVDKSYLQTSAYQAGKQNAEGSLPSYFTLHTNLEVNGVAIPSVPFQSNFTTDINEETGELQMFWNEPFTDPDYNSAYHDGVSEIYDEVNTEERKQQRLANEVAAIKQHREKAKNTKRVSSLIQALLWLFPIVAGVVAFSVFSGWAIFFSLMAIGILTMVSQTQYENWKTTNWKYLYEL